MDHKLAVQNVENISLHAVTPENTNQFYLCGWDSSVQFSRDFGWSSGPVLFRLILAQLNYVERMLSSCVFEHIEKSTFLDNPESKTISW